MLTPPKLSSEQEQIYQALTDTTGSGISLKNPKSGSYLSAFIVADIDGDGADEAIVFYRKNGVSSTDSGLRINVLDCIDGQWLSICDRSADGSEIEKVVISPLGSNDRINVIVGYSTANQSDKYVSVYSYEDSYLEQTFSHSYALFDVAVSGDMEHPDLIVLDDAGTASEQAYAAVYRLAEDGAYHEYKYLFSDSYTDYTQLLYGFLPDGRVAFYVDAATGTSNIQTEILTLEDAQLVNLLERCGRKAGETVRRAGLACTDIDGDGIPEIPVQSVFQGYEEAVESEQVIQTRWLTMQEPLLYTDHESYYSASDGYVFMLPERWEDQVTVVNDTVQNEVQICTYNGSLTEDNPVLMRIYIAYDEEDLNEHLAAGFSLFHTKGTASYLVKAEPDEALSLTIGELLLCFKFI
jgi:hypothetical protein